MQTHGLFFRCLPACCSLQEILESRRQVMEILDVQTAILFKGCVLPCWSWPCSPQVGQPQLPSTWIELVVGICGLGVGDGLFPVWLQKPPGVQTSPPIRGHLIPFLGLPKECSWAWKVGPVQHRSFCPRCLVRRTCCLCSGTGRTGGWGLHCVFARQGTLGATFVLERLAFGVVRL